MNTVALNKRDLDYIVCQLAEVLRKDGLRLMGTNEKSRQLGVHPDTLRKAAREGRIDCEKRGDGKQSRLYFTAESRISV